MRRQLVVLSRGFLFLGDRPFDVSKWRSTVHSCEKSADVQLPMRLVEERKSAELLLTKGCNNDKISTKKKWAHHDVVTPFYYTATAAAFFVPGKHRLTQDPFVAACRVLHFELSNRPHSRKKRWQEQEAKAGGWAAPKSLQWRTSAADGPSPKPSQ